MGEQKYKKGLILLPETPNEPGGIEVTVPPAYTHFRAVAGITMPDVPPDEGKPEGSYVTIEVLVNGVRKFLRGPPARRWFEEIDIDVKSGDWVRLLVGDGGDNNLCDHTPFAMARFES